jgi:hypothetical protein
MSAKKKPPRKISGWPRFREVTLHAAPKGKRGRGDARPEPKMGAWAVEIKRAQVRKCRSAAKCTGVAGRCAAKAARIRAFQIFTVGGLAESVKATYAG